MLRDVDLLLPDRRADARSSACLSVPTLDEKAWRATEPHTPNPRARLEAVAELNRAGIPTGILIAPLMPGINDAPEQVEEIVALATEAGAVHIGGQTLFLRGSVQDIFFDWLREHRPDSARTLRAALREGRVRPGRRAAHDRGRRRRAVGPAPVRRPLPRTAARRAARAADQREEVTPPPQGSLF